MNYETLEWTYVLVFTLLFVKIILLRLRLFTENMFNVSGTWYDKEKEKPRLFFHIVALLPFLFSLIFFKACEGEFSGFKNTLYIIASAIFILVAVLIVLFSWSKYFENEGINKIKEKLEQTEKIKEFKIKKDLDIEKIVKKAIDYKVVDKKSEKELIAFMKEEPIKNKIIWIAEVYRSGGISNVDLYSFLDILYEDGTENLTGINRKKLANLIFSNFTKIEGDFVEENVRKNYTYWTSKQKKEFLHKLKITDIQNILKKHKTINKV